MFPDFFSISAIMDKKKNSSSDVPVCGKKTWKKKKIGFQQGNAFYKNRRQTISSVEPISQQQRPPSQRIKDSVRRLNIHDNTCEYIIVKKESLESLWNSGFSEHCKATKMKCNGQLILNKTQQNLISTKGSLMCNTCNWVGKSHRLYDEYLRSGRSKRGRHNSTLNDALGFGLLNLPIGATAFTELMLTLGIVPGSSRGLNALISRCGKDMVNLGQSVIEETRNLTKQYSNNWDVSTDTTYNNPIFSNKTPFQYGSQAASTTVEEVTGKRKIVHVATHSKLCTRATRARNKG